MIVVHAERIEQNLSLTNFERQTARAGSQASRPESSTAAPEDERAPSVAGSRGRGGFSVFPIRRARSSAERAVFPPRSCGGGGNQGNTGSARSRASEQRGGRPCAAPAGVKGAPQ